MPKDVKEGYTYTKGAGSHAEIYAVNQALLAGANPEDILVYVNRATGTGNGKTTTTKYDPFVTCPHCEYILKQLGVNVVSNVEI